MAWGFDSVGCPSGNVFGRSVRVPEAIGSRRLAPAIQEMFAFQAKFDDIAGNGIYKKIWVEGKYIPEVPTALRWFVRWLPIVSGATPPSLWAIFIMPLHGIRHRQLRRQWLFLAGQVMQERRMEGTPSMAIPRGHAGALHGMRIQWVAFQATCSGGSFAFRRQSAVADWPRLFKNGLPFRQSLMTWRGAVEALCEQLIEGKRVVKKLRKWGEIANFAENKVIMYAYCNGTFSRSMRL
jgi:hypothetical protein